MKHFRLYKLPALVRRGKPSARLMQLEDHVVKLTNLVEEQSRIIVQMAKINHSECQMKPRKKSPEMTVLNEFETDELDLISCELPDDCNCLTLDDCDLSCKR